MTGRTHDLHSDATPFTVAADMPIGQTPVASVEIHRGDAVIATRVRSPHPPTVSLTAPAAGSVLKRTAKTVHVTWTAGDADGDRLRAAIDYSRANGTGWRHLYSGPNTGSVTLPRRLFDGSKNARMRVRVTDGFNEAAAVSGKLVVKPMPAILRLDLPKGKLRMRAGTLTHFHATATAALGQPVKSSSVTWSEGGHVLSRGLDLTKKLPPGTHHLTVTLQFNGMKVSQSPLVSILSSPAHVLAYSGPTSLSTSATKMTFHITTTTSATLHVASKDYSVGTTSKSITVTITPGHGDLEVPLTITTAGHVTNSTLIVPRD